VGQTRVAMGHDLPALAQLESGATDGVPSAF
jgi:hypothetical protein